MAGFIRFALVGLRLVYAVFFLAIGAIMTRNLASPFKFPTTEAAAFIDALTASGFAGRWIVTIDILA